MREIILVLILLEASLIFYRLTEIKDLMVYKECKVTIKYEA